MRRIVLAGGPVDGLRTVAYSETVTLAVAGWRLVYTRTARRHRGRCVYRYQPRRPQ